MLTRSGYAVIEAGDGVEAQRIATAQRGGIDVLLTDVLMPGIRGAELALRLREGYPGLRVVYMSGFRDTEPRADVDSGDAVFLPKPFVRSTLLEAIGKIGTSA
jgi:CheY-like chemotaxis protein